MSSRILNIEFWFLIFKISFTEQFFTFHDIKCEMWKNCFVKLILKIKNQNSIFKMCELWKTNFALGGIRITIRLTARPRGLHGKERIIKKQNSIFIILVEDRKLKRFDLHWLIESIPDSIWSLFPMPYSFCLVPLWWNTFKVF